MRYIAVIKLKDTNNRQGYYEKFFDMDEWVINNGTLQLITHIGTDVNYKLFPLVDILEVDIKTTGEKQ